MIMSPLAAASWTIIHCLIRSKCTLQPWWQNFEDKKVAVSQEVLYLENFWALAKKVFTNTYIMQIFNKMNCLWHITSWDTLYPPLTICCCHFFVSVFSNFKACAYAAKIWNSNWLCNTNNISRNTLQHNTLTLIGLTRFKLCFDFKEKIVCL